MPPSFRTADKRGPFRPQEGIGMTIRKTSAEAHAQLHMKRSIAATSLSTSAQHSLTFEMESLS